MVWVGNGTGKRITMSVDESSGRDPAGGSRPHYVDEPLPPRDRPIAPDGPEESALLDDLQARIAHLDAIAWNLPARQADLYLPPEAAWPADES